MAWLDAGMAAGVLTPADARCCCCWPCTFTGMLAGMLVGT